MSPRAIAISEATAAQVIADAGSRLHWLAHEAERMQDDEVRLGRRLSASAWTDLLQDIRREQA